MTEPSNAELAARIADFKADNRAAFDRLENRFSKVVSADVYALEIKELRDDIKDLVAALTLERAERIKALVDEKKARDAYADDQAKKRTNLIRFVVSAIVIPVGLVVVQLYGTIRGFG
jgi:hypothetical protein